MPNSVAYFRLQAERARAFADVAVKPDMRATWEQLAKQFDFLADVSERHGPWRHEVSVSRAAAPKLRSSSRSS